MRAQMLVDQMVYLLPDGTPVRAVYATRYGPAGLWLLYALDVSPDDPPLYLEDPNRCDQFIELAAPPQQPTASPWMVLRISRSRLTSHDLRPAEYTTLV